MDTPLVVEELGKIDKSRVGSLNHWVGGLVHITVQTRYYLQYLTMVLVSYMKSLTEVSLLALNHGMEYLMHNPHEPIIYSRNKIYMNHEISHQCYSFLFFTGQNSVHFDRIIMWLSSNLSW